MEREMVGWDVYDKDGEKVGRVATVYINDESQRPEWVTVHTGLFGHKESFVPLSGSQAARDGLHVGWRKDMIKDAPRIDADGHLSEKDSAGLYEYYGLPAQREPMAGEGQRQDQLKGRQGQARAPGQERTQDRSGDGEQLMTRSQERARRADTGPVRLRKHVVTETRQVPVDGRDVRGGVQDKVPGERVDVDDSTGRSRH